MWWFANIRYDFRESGGDYMVIYNLVLTNITLPLVILALLFSIKVFYRWMKLPVVGFVIGILCGIIILCNIVTILGSHYYTRSKACAKLFDNSSILFTKGKMNDDYQKWISIKRNRYLIGNEQKYQCDIGNNLTLVFIGIISSAFLILVILDYFSRMDKVLYNQYPI